MIRRLIFVAQTDIQCEPTAESPVILNVPIDLIGQRVLGDSAIVPKASDATGSSGWKAEQKVSGGITGIVAAKTDAAVLVVAPIVADHQMRVVDPELQRVIPPNPGDRLAASVVDIVLND